VVRLAVSRDRPQGRCLCRQVSPLTARHTPDAFEDIPDRGRGHLTQTRSAALDTREECEER
jgi:hypothetical protein